MQFPEVVECQQDRRRIRTAATETAAERQPFFDADIDAGQAMGFGLQQAGGANAQILIGRDTCQRRRQTHQAVGTWRKAQPVTLSEKAKHRLQQVVAIGTAADDMQEEVEFGGRRIDALPVPELAAGSHGMQSTAGSRFGSAVGHICHSSMRRRSAKPLSCSTKRRPGRACGSSLSYS
ncbi:MAG: hypothetical protein AW09_001652 [Candidatus Accumulibacter phosphatis]|uniref:Uncharacterized protein n=1 Tax=Candidatus Accumulibacter phosphatis TaxID=327160 RepID=A0A080LWI6_9PROT|nr:MAG: hypothetical protein AW09_001652 [Candidatus Accumulibacter phosphatis]